MNVDFIKRFHIIAKVLLVAASLDYFLVTQSANVQAIPNGPRVEIKPSIPVVLFEAQAISNKVLTCKALGDKPGMFNLLRWSGPNRLDNWDELSKRHKVRETTRNGHAIELEFQRPTPDDSGVYYCLGTYQSSDIYNASVTVKVYNPIKLESCPDRQFIIEGRRNQKITCRITGDSPNVVFFKNDEPIEKLENRYKWDNDDSLEILGEVNSGDAGLYAVEVTTDMTGDRRVQHINVEVHSKPEIVPSSSVNSIAEFNGIDGEPAELKCEVKGTPRPLVYWVDPRLRNSSLVGGYHVNMETGVLHIDRVNRVDDHGEFQCFAYNSVDQVSRKVTMAVLQRPSVVAFENKTVDEGSDVTFECRSTGFPRPNMSVRRQGLNQVAYKLGDGNVTDISEGEEGGGAEIYIYQVRLRATRAHYGLHYCNATNMAGSAERVGMLYVRHRPDLSATPPEQYVKLGRNLTVTCHIRAYPKPTVSWYADTQQIINLETNFKTSPDGQTHIVTMMPPQSLQTSFIRYRCIAQNDMGISEQTIIPRYTTAPGAVYATVLDTTPTTIKFLITVPNDGGDRIKAYKYKLDGYTLDPSNPLSTYPHDKQNETYLTASPSISTYTIRNLYPFYKYTIVIRAVNDMGDGDATEVHVETRRPSKPDPPVIIKQASISTSEYPSEYQNGFFLKWAPPELDNGDPIKRYLIKFHRIELNSPESLTNLIETKTLDQPSDRPLNAKIGPLDTNRYYKIQIQAINRYGDSEPASIIVYTPSDRLVMPDFEPQVLPWLTEPSTTLLVVVLVFALCLFIIIDLVFCFYFQIGISHFIRQCCCPPKTNSVISDKTYT